MKPDVKRFKFIVDKINTMCKNGIKPWKSEVVLHAGSRKRENNCYLQVQI